MGFCIQLHIWLIRAWSQHPDNLLAHLDNAVAVSGSKSHRSVHIGVCVFRGGSCPENLHQELEDQDSTWILQCPSLVTLSALLARSVLS